MGHAATCVPFFFAQAKDRFLIKWLIAGKKRIPFSSKHRIEEPSRHKKASMSTPDH